jgi:hypothetical protein
MSKKFRHFNNTPSSQTFRLYIICGLFNYAVSSFDYMASDATVQELKLFLRLSAVKSPRPISRVRIAL